MVGFPHLLLCKMNANEISLTMYSKFVKYFNNILFAFFEFHFVRYLMTIFLLFKDLFCYPI